MEKNVTLNEARETINHLVQGVDPYTGEVLEEVLFLQNPRMIRCFALMSELLTRVIEKSKGQEQRKRAQFCISRDMTDSIRFPPGDIGVKNLLAAVNKTIDTENVEELSVGRFYALLKQKGLLEKSQGQGIAKTVTNEASSKIGIKTVRSTFQGEEYDRILYSEEAKHYIKKKLPEWFPLEKPS